MEFGEKLKSLRESKRLGINQLALKSGVSASQISRFESGKRKDPTFETVQKLATALDVSVSYFGIDNDKHPYYALNNKDERDIQKQLKNMVDGLDSDSSLAFFSDGSELSEEDKRLIRASMEQTLRLTKEIAKKKFTPKKYRHEDD